ncbi:hypothetical protein [Mesorhizobium sp. M6A.T.Cr.TU.016.01.1.1]|uniref:hypothetical protein n=1 Tax=Mesorhizobium sp. M6A.T.Cr.TU.016.01.1.1 TaxID=2493677 RepID=UPI000F758248|nr:hypothetical protein [Mesorhizobium sp. M6A.T.Cr.TU.016.01.1.1]AZO67644.1 hypothetical protein EJ075_23805 [Mesorhizobium sp. M6A.T.Cr.TU.016.01.1.1]
MTRHPLTDEQIAEFWPDADPSDIRRQFDALMAHLTISKARPFPRFPEHMAEIVAEKARTLPDRVNGLKAALAGIPEHWRQYQWSADAKQSFGEKYVRVIGDSGHGTGRQWIAAIPAGPKGNFGTVAEYIAAANPDTITMLLSVYDGFGSDAARDVIAERRRQIEVEGWTTEHDDKCHNDGDMADAGACYALAAHVPSGLQTGSRLIQNHWPWVFSWWKPGTPRRMLVKAAALIIAEIERLDRRDAK